METILIWLGSGFAFSVGFLLGVFLAGCFLKPSNAKQSSVDRVNDLLEDRNKIGWRQVDALERLASAAEIMKANK